MKDEKLIPNKKFYYILSSVGLGLSIVSISLLFSLDILWLNIVLSITCIIYAFIFVKFFLNKESKEKSNFFEILGWIMLIIVFAIIGTTIFIGSIDETNAFSFLKILFTAIDITPGIYLVVNFVTALVTTSGWWG